MQTKRRALFLQRVAEAARAASARKPCGRPVPENLTAEGRQLGLAAIKAAPRCRAERRGGGQCRNPAMKDATRCLKHGGRVEVPGHPHNLRRFFAGADHPAPARSEQDAWDRMTPAEQRDFLAMLPPHVAKKPQVVRQLAGMWREVEHEGYRAWARLMAGLTRA